MRVLLIDDNPEQLKYYADGIVEADDEVIVERIRPKGKRFMQDLAARLPGATLVATDKDLTPALAGLTGAAVVEMCEEQVIPVVRYSKQPEARNLRQASVFEMRLGDDSDRHPERIAALARGFADVRARVTAASEVLKSRGPGEVLALVLKRPELELTFARYASRLMTAPGAVAQRALQLEPTNDLDGRLDLLTYVVGHLLVNAVLAFPGPLLPLETLAGYFATTPSECHAAREVLQSARYQGPFDRLDEYYWRDLLDQWCERDENPERPDDDGQARRSVLEAALHRPVVRHGCARCGGENGGYWCPFKKRPVCLREDCSTDEDSWIPAGASMCRTERDFFDIWKSMVGR